MLEHLSSSTGWLVLLCCLLAACLALLCILLKRQKALSAQIREQSEQTLQRSSAQAEMLEEHLRNELARQQQTYTAALTESTRSTSQHMDVLSTRLDVFDQSQDIRLHRISSTLDNRLSQNDQKAEQLRDSLNAGMEKLQRENAEKLEQMRQTVDEKLHETLNKRLGESFSLVNERLEQVYKGLGEMQSLASGVGGAHQR